MDLCKQNFIKAVDERPLGLQWDFGPSHVIKQSVDAAYLIILTMLTQQTTRWPIFSA